MIHDAYVEVTCDGDECRETANVELEYVYHSYSGKSGQYDSSESKIGAKLTEDFEWIVIDGKHYCCEDCAE